MTIVEFIHETSWADLSLSVRQQARRCLLDTLGVAIAGRQTQLSRIIYDFVAANFSGSGAKLWLDGRSVSPPGAVLAHGMTVDAMDIHDGYNLTKGHAGVAVVPCTLLAAGAAPGPVCGEELLATLVMGYEIALRAGIVLHDTAADYHASGAWNALGAAAVVARQKGLDAAATRHALGIAEYHGPRAPMMRCIDHPTMLKDASGWGAMAGVSAALLAQAGFTGAPAEIGTGTIWTSLGRNWLILEGYFKPQAVCRWAQPAIAAALTLRQNQFFELANVRQIRVATFAAAARLAIQAPRTTEEAQYSLPFPLAAALVHGRLGPEELSGEALQDRRILDLASRVRLEEVAELSARFPAQRLACITIEMEDGTTFNSGQVAALWERDDRPGDDALRDKFRWLAGTVLADERMADLETMIWRCEELQNVTDLLTLLAAPI